jgi:glycerol-3-phosphate dehydrogenase
MKTRLFDVIIIGGGINGAGIARDAAERGLSVYLAEKNDFATGTTFRSTKLIHGGLRYLEHYEIGLVRESLREREILIKYAPHLIRPIKFVIPVFEDNKYGYGKVKLGLVAYDILSYDKSLENHRAYNCDELHMLEPYIRTEQCRGGFLYYDCQVEYPERLCMENLLMARNAGAAVNNYTTVFDFIEEKRTIRGVRIKDNFTGETSDILGKIVVNASGPWVDEVLKLSGYKPAEHMGGTKGSHLLVRKFRHGPQHAIYVPAYQDGRPFFIIPWRDYYWVGTTDLHFQDDLDRVAASKAEIQYLLREINHLFPDAAVSEHDIHYCLAGIRPLPIAESSEEEAEITRRHLVYDHEDEEIDGLLSIIGGKLTTYRNLAQETVDTIYDKLGETSQPCRTAEEPLWGGEIADVQDYTEEMYERFGEINALDKDQIAYLISIYGSKFTEIMQTLQHDDEYKGRLCKDLPDIKGQIVFSLKHEMPKTVADILMRRTGIGTSASKGLDCAEAAAKIVGKISGWNRKRINREVENYEICVAGLYGCLPGG